MSTPSDHEASPFEFSHNEFLGWYDALSRQFLRPALSTIGRLLNQRLDLELNEFERVRIRVGGGRIKHPYRLWTKLLQPRHSNQVTSLESITEVIGDLVGTRIVCNNLCDIARLRAVIGSLPTTDDSESLPLSVQPDSERLYYLDPKPTGYRAYHVHLVTLVPGMDGLHAVRAELQIRTLLQDGWGELTHEDTYKPGTPLPPLAVTLARRMADLLATVDDMAEDLRQELDRTVQATIDTATTPERSVSHDDQKAPAQPDQDLAQAKLVAETQRVLEALTRPAPLAAIAAELQRRLGPEVAHGWGGFGTFKSLLLAAHPSVELIDEGPGYVVPEGTEPRHLARIVPSAPAIPPDADPVLAKLRDIDRNAPALSSQQMHDLMRALSIALSSDRWHEADLPVDGVPLLSHLSLLARVGRDVVAQEDVHVSRQHLDYLLKSQYYGGRLRPTDDMEQVARQIAEFLHERAVRLGLSISTDERVALDRFMMNAVQAGSETD